MGQLQNLLFLSALCCPAATQHSAPSSTHSDGCKDYGHQFERVFAVVGEAAMLNCTLVSLDVFDLHNVSYNVSWYRGGTQLGLGQDPGHTLARGTTLWVLNAHLRDTGKYMCVVRTAGQCFSLTSSLIVNQTQSDCRRPYTFYQSLTNLVHDKVVCPLKDLLNEVGDSYSIQWFKGCEPIEDQGRYRYVYRGQNLQVRGIEADDHGFYTCTLTFRLDGVLRNMSATIECIVKEEYVLLPRVVEPVNEVLKAEIGSSFSKVCRVFVPCVGKHLVDVSWLKNGADDYFHPDTSERIYHQAQPDQRQLDGEAGVWLSHLLMFSKVEQEDLYVNYSCIVQSFSGFVVAQFTLLPADPNLMLAVGLLLVCLALLFTAAVIFYFLFKIHIVLWFRRTFPILYTNTDTDGKLYDAYVAYPGLFGGGASKEVEVFALHTLPQELEGTCGYKLFIPGRDSLPGEAVVDVVEENLRSSRRLLLLYSASTFSSSEDSGGGVVSEAWQEWYERETAMHQALLEGSLVVVLLELVELCPAQLALLPPALRHLRRKQGALHLRKDQSARRTARRPRGRSLAARGEVEGEEQQEMELGLKSPTLGPSTRFWKELRYHMPVRGKRTPLTLNL